VAPGNRVIFDIIIETYGIADNSAEGSYGWGLNLQVDPDVLDIDTVAKKARVTGENTYGYFLYEFAEWYWYDFPTFLSGVGDPVTGFWRDISAVIMPTPSGGAGDGFSGLKLCTVWVTSKSDMQHCLIELSSIRIRHNEYKV
jgi:hypothetical protein